MIKVNCSVAMQVRYEVKCYIEFVVLFFGSHWQDERAPFVKISIQLKNIFSITTIVVDLSTIKIVDETAGHNKGY